MSEHPKKSARRMAAVLGLGVLAAVVVAGILVAVNRGKSEKNPSDGVYKVPKSIPSDCSRPVEAQIMAFLATVPNGSTVRFRAGACYGQDRTIVLGDRERLEIDGNGATFQRITPPNPYNPTVPNTNNANWRVLRGDTIELRNMVIRGNYVPPPVRGGGSGPQGQYTDQGISIWGGVNVSVIDVSVFNTDGEFVEADPDVETARKRYGGDYAKAAPSRNILIDNLRGEHAARQCTAATHVDGFVMKNSFIADCQQTGFDAEIDVAGEILRNIKILNNTFSGSYFAAIQVANLNLPGFEGNVENIEFSGNTMTMAGTTCLPGILIGNENKGSIQQLKIDGNTLLTIGDGILFNGESGKVNGTVTNNKIRKTIDAAGCDNPNFKPPYATPIRLNGSPLALSGNTFQGFCCEQNR